MAVKKVVLALPKFWPRGEFLGESYADLVMNLSAGHKVTVVSWMPQFPISFLSHRVEFVYSKVFRNIWVSHFYYCITLIWSLLKTRPDLVYVSTFPPILPALIVAMCSRIFRFNYVYHVQDIHPEIIAREFKLPSILVRFFLFFDGFTTRGASIVVTVTPAMQRFLSRTRPIQCPIVVLKNPARRFFSDCLDKANRFVYVGNLGRFQYIDLLSRAIGKYCRSGGALSFIFIGDGSRRHLIQNLADSFDNVVYLGSLTASEAARYLERSQWAVLPFNSAIDGLAFPSKSSGYLWSGCHIVTIAEKGSEVEKWAQENTVSFNVPPDINEMYKFFNAIEVGQFDETILRTAPPDFSEISSEHFRENLNRVIIEALG